MASAAIAPDPNRQTPPDNMASLYWKAVEDCLVTFYGVAQFQAEQDVAALQLRLPPSSDNLIFHAEPWHIAANLTGLSTIPPAEAYRALLQRNALA